MLIRESIEAYKDELNKVSDQVSRLEKIVLMNQDDVTARSLLGKMKDWKFDLIEMVELLDHEASLKPKYM